MSPLKRAILRGSCCRRRMVTGSDVGRTAQHAGLWLGRGIKEPSRGRPSAPRQRRAARTPAARAPQFLALIGAQVPTEVKYTIQNVVGLEVGLAAIEVREPSRSEAPLFVEDEPDAPAPARDGLAAAAALRLRARRALGAVDPREAPVREARARRALEDLARRALEDLAIGHVRRRFRQGLKQRLRPLVRRAQWMEPHRHLALGKGVGQALAEAQLCTLDSLAAATALGAAARSGFEKVGHG